ncbi:MAG: lipoate--protein ligase [Anaerolineaceae bacterium]|nr:MAG: lipoate--protein ligase [Chloroflexi bacterium HGW-Chloroflexi-8]
MIFVDNQNHTDARINLAIEEHLLRNYQTDEEILLFYINGPSIIIGRNQNTIEEINQKYVEEHGIHVVRRLSGGGAVYHDLGNLNFSFISNSGHENIQNFKKFTAPVVKALNDMGVPAELGGRNDILVEERKVSGNAQYISGNRMVSHGTLLFNSDLSVVSESLNVKASKISSKGIKSIRSRVANISEYLPEQIDVFTFRERVKNGILADSKNFEYVLTDQDWVSINKISEERYQKWEWNFGRSPVFNIQKTERFPIGEIDARIEVEGGIIKHIRFFGDYLGLSDVGEIENKLVGCQFKKESMETALKDVDLHQFFGDLDKKELIRFIYE